MNPTDQTNLDHIRIDREHLYREEMITDMKVGSLQCLVPVKADGSEDPTRPRRFIGQAQVMSQAGPLPIQAPIEASTLSEAVEKFPDAVKQAIEKLIDEARDFQRQEAARIIVPGRDSAPGGIMIP